MEGQAIPGKHRNYGGRRLTRETHFNFGRAARLAYMPASRSKQAARARAKGSLRLHCAGKETATKTDEGAGWDTWLNDHIKNLWAVNDQRVSFLKI